MKKFGNKVNFLKQIGWHGTWDEIEKYATNASSNTGGRYYSRFSIEKPQRPSELREVCAPVGRLKKIQRSIYLTLAQRVSFDDSIHGGVRGRSYLTNGEAHRGSIHFFLVDLLKFYPSISNRRVYDVLVELMSPDIARVVTGLLTAHGHLPTGSPASAFIGNLVLQQLDQDLKNIAQHSGLKYTRYVDDLTFSSRKCFADTDIPKQILESIRKAGFVNKSRKTKYQIGGTIITGVLVDCQELKLPKPYLRLIEGELQRGDNPNRIQGMLAYAASIAASNRRYRQSINA